jgi:hypothetical protein
MAIKLDHRDGPQHRTSHPASSATSPRSCAHHGQAVSVDLCRGGVNVHQDQGDERGRGAAA